MAVQYNNVNINGRNYNNGDTFVSDEASVWAGSSDGTNGSGTVPKGATITFIGYQADYSWQKYNYIVKSTSFNGNYQCWTDIKPFPPGTCTVSYDLNGGSGSFSSHTVNIGGSVTISSTRPTRFGYNFVCWMSGSTEYYPGNTYTFSSNTTLTAYYEYVWLETTTAVNKTANIRYGGEMYYFAVKTSTADDYTFYSASSGDTKMTLYNSSGSSLATDDDSGDGNNFQKRYALSANTTYYLGVQWYSSSTTGTFPVHMRRTYYVSYNINGGSSTAPSAFYKMHDISATLSTTTPTRNTSTGNGYTITFNANGGTCSTSSLTATNTYTYSFKNWNTASGGSGTSYSSGATYSANSDATLYAQWNTTTSRGSITLPTATQAGYIFQGWGESSAATTGVTGTYTPTASKTLYAVWQLEPKQALLHARSGGQFVEDPLVKIKVSGNWHVAKSVKLRAKNDF